VPEDAPIAWPAPPADFVPCVSTLTSCDVSARLSAGRGVDALVPPAVLSLLRRYGLYAGAAEPVGSHAMAWFVDGARASSTATRTRRVALFGGSFSPFTNGHGDAAAELLNCERVDEVAFAACIARMCVCAKQGHVWVRVVLRRCGLCRVGLGRTSRRCASAQRTGAC
jgi:hypothetical protein